MIKQKLSHFFTTAVEFLYQTCTYELGNMQQVQRMSIESRYQDFYAALVDEICLQFKKFADDGENGAACQYTDLILLLMDSLIFNIYSRHKQNDKAKIHNSVYQASVASVGQLGIQGSGKYNESGQFTGSVALNPSGPHEVTAFIQAIEGLLKNKTFFRHLGQLMSYNDSDQNKLQLSFFINSLEYMVEKEGMTEEGLTLYQKNRKNIEDYIVDMQKMAEEDEIKEVNNLLFSKKLFKIKKILSIKNETSSPREVHFTVLRIYFAAYSKSRSNFKRKHFTSLQNTGENQIYTLMKMYIQSQSKRDNLFKESEQGEPLLDFIVNLLLLMFYPVFTQFQLIFDEHVTPNFQLKPYQFFPKIERVLYDIFIPFFEQLPTELYNILSQICQLVKVSPNFTDSTSPIFPVTTLFINRFLLNPDLKILGPLTVDIEDFVQAANTFKDLFFVNVSKAHQQIPQFLKTSHKLRTIFEKSVTSYDEDRVLDVYSYFITDPMLRNDYSFLYGYTNVVKFSNLDEKEVEIEHFDPSKLPRRTKPPVQEAKKKPEDRNFSDSESNKIEEEVEDLPPDSPKPQSKQHSDREFEDRHDTPSESEIIEKLTGLKADKSLIEQHVEDSFRSPNQPTYEDYNMRQQRQYQQQFQPAAGDKTPPLSKTGTQQLPQPFEQPQQKVPPPPTPNLLAEYMIPTILNRKDQATQTHAVKQSGIQTAGDQSPISFYQVGPQAGSNSFSQLSHQQSPEVPLVVKQPMSNLSRKDSVLDKDQRIQLDDAIKPLQDQISKQHYEYEQMVQKYEKELADLKKKHQQSDSERLQEIGELNEMINEREIEIKNLQDEKYDLRRLVDSQNEERVELHQQISELMDQKEILIHTIEQLKSKQPMGYERSDELSLSDKIQYYKKKGSAPRNDEYYQISEMIKNKQMSLLQGQAQEEITRRRTQRR